MNKNKKWVIIIFSAIVLLAAILRFWQLGQVPISPDWDEVALGYNAYSILHTGRDEYGKFLPIVLESFGDYKPALYAYLSIPPVAVFGLNVFAVRLPSAVLGVLTVIAVFFLVKELFKKNSIALITSFLLAISPWHIQFSRVAFETNVGLAFNVFGALFFVKGLKKPWLLFLSVLFFALNLYVYQSEKVFAPLLVLLLIILFWKKLWALPKKYLVFSCILGTLVALPIVFYTFLSSNGLSRAQGVSILSPSSGIPQQISERYLFNKSTHDAVGLVLDNGRFMYAKAIIANYLSHFDINWLFITGDNPRHHAPDMGLLYLWELPFLGIGIYQLIFGKFEKRTKLLVFGWFLIAPLPAAVTIGVPHAVRTLNFLPTFQIVTALGVLQTIVFFRKKSLYHIPYGWIVLVGITFFALFNVSYYLDQYFVQQNYFNAQYWQYGYDQIVPASAQLAKSYPRVVVSDKVPMDQSYMFFLFYLKYDPALYQKQFIAQGNGDKHFGNYVFRTLNWSQDEAQKNTLFVGNASEFPQDVQGTIKTIYNVDGTPLVKIVGR